MIPKFDDDLNIVAKLPDEPSEETGYPADVLKHEFDKAGLAIQQFVNETLIPAIAAGKIPFAPTSAISEDNIQAAIEAVQSELSDAVAGTIPNGSVTREKLSAALLKRVYGGLAVVSFDRPTEQDNIGTDYPQGQTWVRPEFRLTNLATTAWVTAGCTVDAADNHTVVTGSKETASVSVTQDLTVDGALGDTVYVMFSVAERDPGIRSLTYSINEAPAQPVSEVSQPVELTTDKKVTVKITAEWETTSAASGSFTVQDMTIVNVTKLRRDSLSAPFSGRWEDFLDEFRPFTTLDVPSEVYMQVANGVWWEAVPPVLDAKRGGTGHNKTTPGSVLVGKTGGYDQLAPSAAGQVLSQLAGDTKWVNPKDVGIPRVMTGSYTGNSYHRDIDLGVTPILLAICPVNGPYVTTDVGYKGLRDASTVIPAGCTMSQYNGRDDPSTATLSGNLLKLRSGYAMSYLNERGRVYKWVAIY